MTNTHNTHILLAFYSLQGVTPHVYVIMLRNIVVGKEVRPALGLGRTENSSQDFCLQIVFHAAASLPHE